MDRILRRHEDQVKKPYTKARAAVKRPGFLFDRMTPRLYHMERHMKKATPSLFFKILISTTLSILISLLITSTILYINFESIALKQVYAHDMATLTQTGRGIHALTNMAVTLSGQIYNDLNVARLMYYAEPGMNDIRTADAQLTNFRLSIPFIESVYIYNGKQKVFYVNSIINRNENREAIQKKSEFDDTFAVELVDSFRKYRPYRPIPRTYVTNKAEKTIKNYYTFLMYDAFSGDDIGHAVIINFSEEWISNNISDGSPANNSWQFILDQSGIVVSGSGLYPMMSDLRAIPYIQTILAAESSGSFMETIDGRKYLVSYTEPDMAGWRQVKATPRDYILRSVTRMKYITIFIGLALVMVGLIASYFLTKRLYVPIDTLMTTLRKLSLEEKNNVHLLRQVFFRDIFLGRGAYDGQTIEIKLEELETAFNAAGYFCIVLLKIDRYLAFSQEFTAVDQSLVKNAIMSACAEIIPGRAKVSLLDMGNNGIVVILNSLDVRGDLAPDVLEERLVILRKTIEGNHNLSVSITVSNTEAGIQNLQDMYAETLEASFYRLYRGHGCIIHAREVQSIASETYEYPGATEKRLVTALLAGKIVDARERYDEIVSGTNNHPVNAFNLMLSRVVFALDETLKTVRKYYGVDLEIGKNISVAKLSNAETIGEINAQLYAVFDDIGDVLLDRKNNRNGQTVEKINRHIESGYMRQDLYIDSIAEYLGKSPAYISHLYKRHTGTTILDKIVDVRMAHANNLLLTTELSVTEISERTGFSSSSYLFKVFKKINGVTPNEFRGRQEKHT